jgi:hypothetical protein
MNMDMEHHGQMGHHCDGMPEAEVSGTEDLDGTPSVRAASEDNCPMNCCVQGQTHSANSAASAHLLPPMAVTDKGNLFVPVMFTSAGFSSHTDRGPPVATLVA